MLHILCIKSKCYIEFCTLHQFYIYYEELNPGE
jgi:hypothetical protein